MVPLFPLPSDGSRGILIVEDDADLADSLAAYLRFDGYVVTVVGSAFACYRALGVTGYALAILDLSLPDQDGLVLAKYLRFNTSMRIIILTARTSIDDRAMGYDAGADEYFGKPVDFQEISAAVSRLLMSSGADDGVASHGWTLLNSTWELVSPMGDRYVLTSKEFSLVQALAVGIGVVVPHEELLRALGYTNDEYGRRSLETIMYRLRKKITQDDGIPIKTSHGSGYTFTAPLALV
ncbi:response regulator transcription factor [Chlorobium phaeovibrioides]|uniref:Response regulator n=1 Tax=Chlorobium phaeovibrioides TaxID=1094 RepID=A0ABW9UR52_CHLPH|nr:response regulator transcription factor [Chlorobium phaeovibrioides]MWV54397.1 response regulator [Chlorobium phaeovibrioides]